MQLYEKYRPVTPKDFICQPKVVRAIERLTARPDWDRDAFWIQGPSGTGKTSLAWIVNEAHAMSRQAVQAWLTLLERLPAKRLIIFTTTEPLQEDLFGNFSSPFARRCKVFSFTNQGLAQSFAARAKEIATVEQLDGKPLQAYVRLVQECHNNLGAVLQRVEQGEMLP